MCLTSLGELLAPASIAKFVRGLVKMLERPSFAARRSTP
jgi:hypothetical protein